MSDGRSADMDDPLAWCMTTALLTARVPHMCRDSIIVFGRSLGGAVAIDLLASRGHEVRGKCAL